MKKIYVITGQTATGKTSYAVQLAAQVDGELINCDSRQIYKQLDIITGKDLDKTTGIFTKVKTKNNFDIGYYQTSNFQDPTSKLWLYDIVDPNKPFSPFDYSICSTEVIADIFSRNKTPIIVGGSYFYLKNLLYGTIETMVEPNEELRNELNGKSIQELQNEIKQINLDLFNSLNNSEKHNPHRLIRKIEILQSKPNTTKTQQSLLNQFPDVSLEMIGFQFESKDMLQSMITDRVEKRLQTGAVDEVKSLLSSYNEAAPGLNTIGYKQIISFLQNKRSFDEMKQEWIIKEVQYAKRQMTFMKKDPHIQWEKITSK